jgi:AraC-like DNA-binding protein
MKIALEVASLVTCGFAWLLSRAIFRVQNKREIWPQYIVAILFLSTLTLYLFGSDNRGVLLGYIENIQMLIGSAMLMMILVEAIDGPKTSQTEKRFRFYFAGGYITLLAIAFVARLPEFQTWQSSIQVSLAAIALVGASGAVLYRKKHPLKKPDNQKLSRPTARATPNPVLAKMILNLLENDNIFLSSDIKVIHIAKWLQQPAYKISQCIVSDLGFPNFNQLINSYRIKDAKRRLSSPEFDDCSILVISMDCGFGSLGPFNRAFKLDTGLTPSEFRSIRTA